VGVGVGAHAFILSNILIGIVTQDHILVHFMISLCRRAIPCGVIMRHGCDYYYWGRCRWVGITIGLVICL
jgi:hypothetical protein